MKQKTSISIGKKVNGLTVISFTNHSKTKEFFRIVGENLEDLLKNISKSQQLLQSYYLPKSLSCLTIPNDQYFSAKERGMKKANMATNLPLILKKIKEVAIPSMVLT